MVEITKTESKTFSGGVTLMAPLKKLAQQRCCIPFDKSFLLFSIFSLKLNNVIVYYTLLYNYIIIFILKYYLTIHSYFVY